MPEPLSADTVRHVAKLGQIALTDEEVETFTQQLGAVLEHANEIESLNLDDIAPVTHALGETNIFREDEVKPSLQRDALLEGAPSYEDGRFRVPRILGEEP